MERFSVSGKLVAKDGKGKELLSYLLEAAKEMEKVENCYCYIVGINETEPDSVYVYEVWENKDAHHASLNIPVFRNLIVKAKPIIRDMKSYPELTIVGGKAKF